jgi:hypothetical protein
MCEDGYGTGIVLQPEQVPPRLTINLTRLPSLGPDTLFPAPCLSQQPSLHRLTKPFIDRPVRETFFHAALPLLDSKRQSADPRRPCDRSFRGRNVCRMLLSSASERHAK